MAYPDGNAQDVALYHLNETSGGALDTSPNGIDGTNSGMTLNQPAVFGTGWASNAAAHHIDIDVISGDFNPPEGSWEFWIISRTAGQWTDSTLHYFGIGRVDASNEVRIFKSAGNDTALDYVAGGFADGVIIAGFDPGTLPTHLAIAWSVAADEVRVFVNGVQTGTTQTGLGTWAGTIATARIANSNSDNSSFLGTYDEVRIGNVYRTTFDVAPQTNIDVSQFGDTIDTQAGDGSLAVQLLVET